MAVYRNVRMDFWTDRKIVDDFTSEDKFFYLYLFTNPHTNLAGCYEISLKQAVIETGMEMKKIKSIIKRFCETHKVIQYCEETGEVLLLNWHKYNWIASESFRKPLQKDIDSIKCCDFKDYLAGVYAEKYGVDTVWTPCPDGVGVRSVSFSLNDIDTKSNTISITESNTDIKFMDTVREIVSYLNEMCGTSYKASSKKTKDCIQARLNDGFTVEDFKTVIYKKAKQWQKDAKMCKFLRPETLFGTKFEGYLNEMEPVVEDDVSRWRVEF